MPRLSKVIHLSLAIIVAAAALSAGGAYLYLRQSLPPVNGRQVVPGLRAPVEVIRDRWGVPHIYAQGEDDLFFAQGYVQAQDRLWQMELFRRAAHGTLAEVLGEDALPGDRLARTLGFRHEAEAEWDALDLEERAVLEAYARGVNAFLSAPGRRLPLEFGLLGYAPARWQPVDTLAWARLLAWSMSSDWQTEIVRARLVRAVGPERAQQLDASIGGADTVAGDLAGLAVLDETLLMEGLGEAWPWFATIGMGGNGWVVGASKSATGRPILASTPQLPVQMPSPWYQMHLVGGRYDVIGATVPGLPCVVIGRNRSIAWGSTRAAVDVEDLYVERVRPGDPPQAEYRGQWEDVRVREEEIRVRRGDPVQMKVHTTRHGPLVTTLELGSPEQVALRWAGAGQPSALARCLPAVNRASDWKEFQAALESWAAPAQILTFADVQGNTGYVVAAAVPGRRGGDGYLPAPGWTGEHEWTDLRSSAALSRGVSRAAETLVAAGGSVSPEGWPSSRRDVAGSSILAGRIAELVAARDRLTMGDAQAIQCDLRGPAQPLLSLLLAMPPEGWVQERATPYLQDWDLHYDAESAGAGIFETFYWHLVHNTLDDELGADLVDAYLNVSPSHRAVMRALSMRPDNPWFDDLRTPERESRDEIITRSYQDAVEWLGRRFGDLPYEWNWGRVHNVTFQHALGTRWPLTLLLSRGAMRAGGSPWCVSATGSDYGRGMVVQVVPSYRMLIDLAEGGSVLAMNTTGQSGNPLSRHYADMIQPWRQGRYHPLLYEREAILQAKAGVLVLAPLPQ